MLASGQLTDSIMSDLAVSHIVVRRKANPGAVGLDKPASLGVRSQLIDVRRPRRVHRVILVLILVLSKTVQDANHTRLTRWKNGVRLELPLGARVHVGHGVGHRALPRLSLSLSLSLSLLPVFRCSQVPAEVAILFPLFVPKPSPTEIRMPFFSIFPFRKLSKKNRSPFCQAEGGKKRAKRGSAARRAP